MTQAKTDLQTTTIRQYRLVFSILAERQSPVNLVMSSRSVPVHVILNIEKNIMLAKPTCCSRSFIRMT